MIPLVLNWGPLGLLAVALVTVVRGDWMPSLVHDKIVALYVKALEERDKIIEKQNKEIERLQQRLDEQLNSSLASTAITGQTLNALIKALPPPADTGHKREGS